MRRRNHASSWTALAPRLRSLGCMLNSGPEPGVEIGQIDVGKELVNKRDAG